MLGGRGWEGNVGRKGLGQMKKVALEEKKDKRGSEREEMRDKIGERKQARGNG